MTPLCVCVCVWRTIITTLYINLLQVPQLNVLNLSSLSSNLRSLPQTSHQDFSSLKQSNTEANQREEVLKKLASAHDSYIEISNNLREGTKVLTQHNAAGTEERTVQQ